MNTAPNENQESPDSRANKINTIWKAVILLYVLVAIGLVFYWEFNDEGLPGMLCALQAEYLFDDSCYIAINVLFSILAMLIPAFAVKFIVEKITGVKIESGK